MIIYNVTIKIDSGTSKDWLDWMLSKHIPDVMATGYFSENSISLIQSEDPEDTDPCYAIRYCCENLEALNKYQNEEAPRLQKEHTDRYLGKFVAFRTIMEEVKRFS